MSHSVLMSMMVATLVVAIVTVIEFAREREDGPVFIAGNGAFTEDQVRQKLMTDGWTNVLISREGRYFQVMAVKDQHTAHLIVAAQSGRLRGDDDD